MEYLKLFTDFIEDLEPLSDAECGRLFRAALEYARTGTPPTLSGNERFVWPNARKQIEKCEQAYQAKANGAAKARAMKSNVNLIGVDIKTHQDASTLIGLDNSQEKEKEKDKDNIKEKKENKEKKESPVRHRYGEYKNVFLTDDEYEKIKQEFPDYHERIERVSEYVAKTGKTYKNFLAVIRSWARNDAVQQDNKPSKPTQNDFNEQRRDDWLKRYIHGRGD